MQKTVKNSTSLLLVIYLIVNSLYIYKYSARIAILNPIVITFTYLLVWILFFKLVLTKINNYSETFLKKLFWFVLIGFSISSILVIASIDGNNLNVDRWSALELTVEGITKGNYPYILKDHMGNMSSNFPGLGFLGLPFYFLGDVGYLQVFTYLLLFLYFVFHKPIKQTLFVLLLFISSPAILWEFIAKSDLMSNLILCYIFIDYWTVKHTNKNLFYKPIPFGVLVGFLIMTRGVLIIPLVLFLLKPFFECTLKTKITFLFFACFSAIITCLPILLAAESLTQILHFNPLVLQTNKSPEIAYVILSLLFVIPFYFPSHKDLLFFSTLGLFLIPLATFIECLIKFGWYTSIFEHKIDLSYLAMCFSGILLFAANHLEIDKKNVPLN